MKKEILASVLGGVLLITAGCSTSVSTTTNSNTAPVTPVTVTNVNSAPLTAPIVVAKYKVGDKIEALWKGRSYYKGTIAALNADGTYNINYDDGDKESNVKEENIKIQVVAPVSTTPPKYKVGEKVDALWKGSSYYRGTIALVNADGTYNINYDDGDKETNVKEMNIKPIVAATGVTYKVGDAVEAKWKGGAAYYKGIIKTVNTDGTYAIDYNDGDKETNVKVEDIKLIK